MTTCNVCGEGKRPDEMHSKYKLRCNDCEYLKNRELALKRRYGITLADYDALFEKQKGKCAICGTTEPGSAHKSKNFCVDHDHDTGQVRALLCDNCNAGLGKFMDDPVLLLKASKYLWRFLLSS